MRTFTRPTSPVSARLRLTAVILLLALASILPSRLLGWAAWLADPVQAIVAPWQHTLGRAARWTRARTEPVALDPAQRAVTEDIIRQRDAATFALVQANAQIEELRKRISEISRGMELNSIPVTPIAAPVIGFAADLAAKALTVRAGRRQNVEENNVAVVGGVHIVGLVRRVGDRTSVVLPITDRAAGALEGRIMIGDVTPGPLCLLKPDGRGRLTGPVEDDPRFRDAAGRPAPIEAGMRVRLYDRSWPLSSHGLIVGQVVRVEPLPSSPLRPVVTVEPIEPIETAREVTIRTSAGDAPPPAPASSAVEKGRSP